MKKTTTVTIKSPTGEIRMNNEGFLIAWETDSTTVKEWSYSPSTGLLLVTFPNGRYSYYGVPYEIARGLIFTDSLGQYLNAEIKGKYEYEKW